MMESGVKMPKLAVAAPERSPPASAEFGTRLRQIRKAQGQTLEELSSASGLSRAAVSRIERGEMSPTYDSLLKIARGLRSDVAKLISGRQPAGGAYDVTRAGEGAEHPADKRFPSRLLAPNLPERALHAFVTEVRAIPIKKYGPWDSHDSEDFLHVLDGVIEVHLRDQQPIRLGKGDSMQVDGRIPHALTAVQEGPSGAKQATAQLLWVSVPFS